MSADGRGGGPAEAAAVATLMPLLSGYYYSAVLHAAVRLGIPDALSREPRSVDALAEACGAAPRELGRLLEALTVLGIVAGQEEGRTYVATPVSDLLREGRDGGLREMALLGGERAVREAWEGLAEAVRSGRPAFEAVHGEPLFSYLDSHPELLVLFQRAWRGPRHWNAAMAESYDFGRHRRLVDVGGGNGALVEAIVARHPELDAVVFDRAAVTSAPPEALSHGPGIQRVAGDCLEGVPAGADVYTLRFVLHDWDDARAVRILRHCRDAMADGGRVLVLELLTRPGQRSTAALLDLSMLVLTGGRERSEDEYRELLARAGLEWVATRWTRVGVSLLEAKAAE